VPEPGALTHPLADQDRLVRRFDHVAVAVRDIRKALDLYVGLLGARFVLGGDNDETGNRIIHLTLGGFKVELMQPLRPDTVLARTIDRRGEGFHHITMVVGDLQETVDSFEAAAIELVGTDLTNSTWRETFVRPRDAGGALLQLVTTDRDWSRPVDGIQVDDVLAGRVAFEDAWPCWRRRTRSPATTASDGPEEGDA
jgi:methylmalonyl-CoA/ethylmalonyl-CoA epimerase